MDKVRTLDKDEYLKFMTTTDRNEAYEIVGVPENYRYSAVMLNAEETLEPMTLYVFPANRPVYYVTYAELVDEHTGFAHTFYPQGV